MPSAARVGDHHTCPCCEPGPVPHVGGPVLPAGCRTVRIQGAPAARVGDPVACDGATDEIVMGEPSVLVGNRPAARVGDPTRHGGVLVTGCGSVQIGATAQSAVLRGASARGAAFCEECARRRTAREATLAQARGTSESAPDAQPQGARRDRATLRDTRARRADLAAYARTQVSHPDQVEAFARIAERAAENAHLAFGDSRWTDPSRVMRDDLQHVLIGEGLLRQDGRGRGEHLVRGFTSAGFAARFTDPSAPSDNQVQHAMAGIVIASRYGRLAEWYALAREEEPEDDALYAATFPLGRALDRTNYRALGDGIRATLGAHPPR